VSAQTDADTLVVGGGMVGMSLAWGLARAGERVLVLDEGDDAFRAARGNFGLVWVQGKGLGWPDYARWTLASAAAWPAFAAALVDQTGVDVELSQPGGLTLCLSDDELRERVARLERLRAELAGERAVTASTPDARAGAVAATVPARDDPAARYPFEALGAADLRRMIPQAGPDVVGAVMCPLDGHVNPLKLLRALVQGFESLGGRLRTGARVERIEPREGGFRVSAGGTTHAAGRLVLAAGLGNRGLAPLVGLSAPVSPNRGQVLVTERLHPFLKHPTMQVRQTGEGVVQIGDSQEDVGFDDGTTLAQLSRIAARAVRCFPLLADVDVVRTWGALRVMSPDGFPIYQASAECPGAFVVTCHSGITLAAQHAGPLVDWIRGGPQPEAIRGFSSERFDVQAH